MTQQKWEALKITVGHFACCFLCAAIIVAILIYGVANNATTYPDVDARAVAAEASR